MNEDLLHYIWKFQLYNHSDLKLTTGEKIEVLTAGIHNFDSGPDFFNGQIKIEGTRWAGNIEIHANSSNWYQHNHQNDKLYDKIILHVVWEDDRPVKHLNGQLVPTIELKGLVSKSVIEKYKKLQESKTWIPCQNEIETVSEIDKVQCLDSNLVQRLQTKSTRIAQLLNITTNDWEATLYLLIAKYFGFKVNAIPFELLASSIDYGIVRKYQHSEKKLSALFYGQAGFLNDELSGSYPIELLEEYNFLKNKHQLVPLDRTIWKFMRMRPANFPTIRISQFISILTTNVHLFQRLISENDIECIHKKLEVKAGNYWNSHFRFDVPTAKTSIKNLGKSSIQILLINTLIPLLFAYGEKTGSQEMKERALSFLQNLPSEKNNIVKKWNALKFTSNSAYDSQALIQLKTIQCDNKNCLNCTIGNSILKRV